MQNSDTTIDRFAIAARLRALLFTRDPRESFGAVAESLGVRESMLRASIDEASPHPWIEVVLAVIRHFGVDPTWILTGVYDSSTHREALEDEESVERMLARTTLPREAKARSTLLDISSQAEGRRPAS